tara:strand:- start:895 stop:1008 length:114 start_codon:yes stop_codon:yes gene_type:complete
VFERIILGQALPNIDEEFIQTGGLEKWLEPKNQLLAV